MPQKNLIKCKSLSEKYKCCGHENCYSIFIRERKVMTLSESSAANGKGFQLNSTFTLLNFN